MTSELERAERVREQARSQWSSDPAGSSAGKGAPVGSPEFFARVEADRYREQAWMHDVFRFESFRDAKVLEVGVGLGTDHIQFARAGAVLTGIDLTPVCVELTRERFRQEDLSSDLRIMDAERLDFPDDHFDAVFSFGVLHHVPDPDRAFAEIRRVLRTGGVFLGALYNRHSAFHAVLRAERLRTGAFLHESLDERLSQIEQSTTDAEPLVRLFSARELRRGLRRAGFDRVAFKRRHPGLGTMERHFSARTLEAIGRRAGWYLVHEAS